MFRLSKWLTGEHTDNPGLWSQLVIFKNKQMPAKRRLLDWLLTLLTFAEKADSFLNRDTLKSSFFSPLITFELLGNIFTFA